MDIRYAKRSEDTEQIRLIQWAARAQKEYQPLKWLHHIPNGGSRNKAEAVKLKQMGVKAGVADLCLPYPSGCYHGLYIEMKYENNVPTKDQIEFLETMQQNDYFVCICYSTEAAQEIILKYLALDKNNLMSTTVMNSNTKRNKQGILVVK